MSCSNYGSTINIVSNKVDTQRCSADCAYSYYHNPNSSCVVINKDEYLDIQTDGTNNVKFNEESQSITSVRLYQPSIHLYNGSQADAELIIQYAGSGKNLLVCIPVTSSDGNGRSNNFFNQFIPFIDASEKNTTQVFNVNSWSLNDVLSYETPYFYYLGNFPFPPCNSKSSIIVFDIKDAATINTDDLNSLKSYIKDTPKATIGSTNYLMYNNRGTIDPNNPNGAGDEYDLVECVEETDGTPNDSTKTISDKNNSSIFSKLGSSEDGVYFIWLIGGLIALALLVLVMLPWIYYKIWPKTNAPSLPPIFTRLVPETKTN